MAAVHSMEMTEALDGPDRIVIEPTAGGKFRASRLSSVEDAVFGPFPCTSQRDAVGAAQTWAFHNSVPVIHLRESA